MIDEIRVRNIALIQEAVLCPSSGLTVLTGETGAGKTALLSACKLLMGERADKTMVREGEKEACVEGRFYLKSAANDAENDEDEADRQDSREVDETVSAQGLSEAGETPSVQNLGEADEVEVVVARRLSADGRSRVTVNGNMSSVSQLAKLIAPSVDLCGQHEHQMLMKAPTHAALLDAWAHEEIASVLSAYQGAYQRAREAAREYERVREAGASSAAALDEARFVLRQIDSVGLVEGEYDELVAYLDKAEHAETLARAAYGAYEGLSSDGGAFDGLNAALAALDEGARYDSTLGGCAQTLREASYLVEDVAREIASYRDDIEYDADELAQAQERVAALQGLMRTYGPRMEDVQARRNEAADLVSMVDDADIRERAAKKALDEAESTLAAQADALLKARQEAAPRFAAEVSAVMASLEMGTAELLCEVTKLPRAQWTSAGPSAAEFLFKPGASMQARPLTRIASGGEMSRVMLAIHVVMGERDRVSTLVFDEVDAGVGGAVAVALARVLADLAQTHQVLVITHLAQVASRADVHYMVEKTQGDLPQTSLFEVEGEARVREIARMLSGDTTAASLAHARELLSR